MFKVTVSVSGMPSVDMMNPSDQERHFLLNAVRDDYFDSLFYKAKQKAQPLIQINTQDQLCIEFWGNPDEAHKYVEFLNHEYVTTRLHVDTMKL